jgi:hypothetical protein
MTYIAELLKDKRVKIAIYALLGLAAVWTLFTVVKRISAEASNNTVEICVDFNQAVDLCQANGYPLADFLSRCQAIGVNSVAVREETIASLAGARKIIYYGDADFGRLNMLDLLSSGGQVSPGSILALDKTDAPYIMKVFSDRYAVQAKQQRAGKYRVISPVFNSDFKPSYWNESLPLGFPGDKLAFISKLGLKAVLRVQNAGNPQWLEGDYGELVSGFMWDGRDVPGYAGNEGKLAASIVRSGKKFVNLEFMYFNGSEKVERAIPSMLVRGHQITAQELSKNFSAGYWLPRWDRAVSERGIRFLLFYFWDNKGIEDNISYLRSVAHEMKSSGYYLGTATPPQYPIGGGLKLWLFFALAAAVVFPLLGLAAGLKQENPFKAYLACNGLTFAGGLLVSACFYDLLLMQKIVDVPGVKAAMLLPLLLSCALIFKPEQLKKALAFRLEVKHVLIALGVLIVFVVLLLRSGNYNVLTSQPEYLVRDGLENLFGYRPRTKEFLLGQPALFLGFYFKNPYLILFGMVGQVSIINTFFHAHSTVVSSAVRSFHGIWFGLLIGWAALWLVKRVIRLIKK